MTALEANSQMDAWLARFNDILNHGDVASIPDMFDETECFWRDILAVSWNIYTAEGRAEIAAMLKSQVAHVLPLTAVRVSTATCCDGLTEARLRIETRHGSGDGVLRLRGGRAWMLLTTLTELASFPEKSGRLRENGALHGVHRDRKTWLELRQDDEQTLGISRQPYCVVVGGGQGGIALGARLKRLGVPTLVLEQNAKPGDSWRRRYKSLCLHDPVWYDHLPYIPFPDHWPVFSPKDKLADWLEMYVKVMELNYWTSTLCKSAEYDSTSGEWTVIVERNGNSHTLKPKHLILATGMSGVPNLPSFRGQDTFQGEQCHSSGYVSGERYAGKRCVVVGSNNSAHDIAADLWEHGAQVTMVQRSATIVARSETLMELSTTSLYSEDALARGITTDVADLTMASWPYRVAPRNSKPVYDRIRERDQEFYRRLDAVGFQYHFGHDDSGIHTSYIRRGSGYYIDVGASDLIADRKIALKSPVEISSIEANALVLSNGERVPADLIVYATGYGSMTGWAAQLINQQIADKVGKCWGVGSGTAGDPGPWEGELRNMWKPTAQDGLWFHGGNLFQSRVYSLFLALQLKARFENVETPVYGRPPVYHTS